MSASILTLASLRSMAPWQQGLRLNSRSW
jgi:hypothetical protein